MRSFFLNPQLLLFCLLAGFATSYAVPIWDSDFWWHLASGQWIWQQQAVPGSDPFGVFGNSDPIRNETVLKGQWLGQLVIYLIYQLGAEQGIVLFRILVLSLTLWLLHSRLRILSVNKVLSLLLVGLAGFALLGFTADRPQLLSTGLSALCFWLVDRARIDGQAKWLYPLPLIGLVWANIHGGVILNLALLILFGLLWWLRQRNWMMPGDILVRPFLGITLLFGLASLVTPNGLNSYRYILQLQGSELQSRTSEYVSSLLVYQQGHWELQLWIGLVLLLALVSLPGLLRREWPLAGTLLVLIGLSVESFRYLVFLITVALPYIGLGLSRLSIRLTDAEEPRRTGLYLLASTGACLALLFWLHPPQAIGGVNPQRYPVQLSQTDPPLTGPGFNLLRWGGYLLWHAPQATPFIDGRMLEGDRLTPYTHILWATPEGRGWFEQGRFNWVLIPYYDAAGEVYALNNYLKSHPGWYVQARGAHGFLYRRR